MSSPPPGSLPVMLRVKVPVVVLSVLGFVPVVASTVVTGGVRLGTYVLASINGFLLSVLPARSWAML